MKITKESLICKIKDLESSQRSLKEDYQLEAFKILLEHMSQEPIAYLTYKGYLLHASDPKVLEYSEPTPLFDNFIGD